jgi:hypothetical protein
VNLSKNVYVVFEVKVKLGQFESFNQMVFKVFQAPTRSGALA